MRRRASSASTRCYGRASTLDLKNDLVAAVGVHDASPAVVAWLERRVASRDPDDLRGDATEWIAWHPIAASVAALDRIARTDRASHVRQEAAEALGDLAMPEAAPALIALAQSLEDLDARREAVEALGARPELEARDALGVDCAAMTPAWTSSAKPWKRSATSRTSAVSCC